MRTLLISHRAKACLVVFFMLLLILPSSLLAQKNSTGPVAGSILCSIRSETEIWSRDKSLPIIVTVKNVSGQRIDIVGIYTFQLTRSSDSKDSKGGASYWAPVDIRTGNALSLVRDDPKGGGKVPEVAIQLEAAESREMILSVDKLFWNLSLSSRWPYQSLFEVAPNGTYELIFDIETDKRMDSQGYPLVTHIKSNAISATIQ